MDIVVITDQSEAAPLAESLKNNTPSPMSYSNTLKGALSQDILDEDKSVENYPMPVKSVTIVKSDDTFRTANRVSGGSDKGLIKMQK
jgi:zinc protease